MQSIRSQMLCMADADPKIHPELMTALRETIQAVGPLSADQLPSHLRRQLLSQLDGDAAVQQLLHSLSKYSSDRD